MPAPDSIKQLVENFELHRREYLVYELYGLTEEDVRLWRR